MQRNTRLSILKDSAKSNVIQNCEPTKNSNSGYHQQSKLMQNQRPSNQRQVEPLSQPNNGPIFEENSHSRSASCFNEDAQLSESLFMTPCFYKNKQCQNDEKMPFGNSEFFQESYSNDVRDLSKELLNFRIQSPQYSQHKNFFPTNYKIKRKSNNKIDSISSLPQKEERILLTPKFQSFYPCEQKAHTNQLQKKEFTRTNKVQQIYEEIYSQNDLHQSFQCQNQCNFALQKIRFSSKALILLDDQDQFKMCGIPAQENQKLNLRRLNSQIKLNEQRQNMLIIEKLQNEQLEQQNYNREIDQIFGLLRDITRDFQNIVYSLKRPGKQIKIQGSGEDFQDQQDELFNRKITGRKRVKTEYSIDL